MFWIKRKKFLPLFLILLFVLWIFPSGGKSDEDVQITRNPILLDTWARAEIQFVGRLMDLPLLDDAQEVPKRLLQDYLNDFEAFVRNLTGFRGNTLEGKAQLVTYNPLASYCMIRRILKLLTPLKGFLLNKEGQMRDKIHVYYLFNVFPHDNWPTQDDLLDALSSLLRISHVYNLKPSDMAVGKILGKETGLHFRATHCVEIGQYALFYKFMDACIEWFEEGLDRLSDGTIDETWLHPAYQEALDQHDKMWDVPPRPMWPHLYSKKVGWIKKFPQFRRIREKRRDTLVQQFGGSLYYNDINYWALCSGQNYLPEDQKSRLFCWYERKSDPFLYICPAKMELLSENPEVVQMYQVIGPQISQILKELASPTLIRSAVADGVKVKGKFTAARTSVQSWIDHKMHPELHHLAKRIEELTGLEVENAVEALQVAAYTFGGHSEVHLDGLDQPDYPLMEYGNRIATFMYYLHEPQLGGQTVFPQARVAANPVQGSAVFWYDVLRNELLDRNTHHGACPVVYGRKWIANKWLRYREQFRKAKCGLAPTDKFQIHLETRGV